MRKTVFTLFAILIIAGCSSNTTKPSADMKSDIQATSTNPETNSSITTEQRQKMVSEATSKLTKDTDEIKGVTWYSDPSTTKIIDTNDFSIYFGIKQNEYIPVLRFKIQYGGDSWLFINQYTLKIDDQTYTIDVKPDYLHKDNKTKVWEWYDAPVTKQSYDLIKNIVNSKKALLRYEGKDKSFDREISEVEKKALQNILDAYVASGGDVNYK